MPSADIRSNRCVPLRGTSAGYASASSAVLVVKERFGAVCRCDEVKLTAGFFVVNTGG